MKNVSIYQEDPLFKNFSKVAYLSVNDDCRVHAIVIDLNWVFSFYDKDRTLLKNHLFDIACYPDKPNTHDIVRDYIEKEIL